MHSALNSAGKSLVNSSLGSTSTPWMRLQIAVVGTYNLRLQTDIVISLKAKLLLCFYFNLVIMLFV